MTTEIQAFEYPPNTKTDPHKEAMKKLAELLTAGWRIQGSPYVITTRGPSEDLDSTSFATKVQVLLIKEG